MVQHQPQTTNQGGTILNPKTIKIRLLPLLPPMAPQEAPQVAWNPNARGSSGGSSAGSSGGLEPQRTRLLRWHPSTLPISLTYSSLFNSNLFFSSLGDSGGSAGGIPPQSKRRFSDSRSSAIFPRILCLIEFGCWLKQKSAVQFL